MPSTVCLHAAACVLLVLVSAGAPAAPQSPRTTSRDASSDVSFEAIRSRAEEARTAGRLDEAIELYGRGIRMRPGWIEGHWYLGTAYYEVEKYPQCRNAFREVVRLQKENGAAWAFKGLCEFQLKNYRIALNDLNKAHGLTVKDPKLILVSRYHRAILLTRFEQYERALQAYSAFSREGNADATVIEGMGIAVLRMPLLPADLPPERRDIVLLAGRASILAGTSGVEAEQAFEELVRRYGDTPNVHYLYGVYLLRDRPEQAIAQFHEELRISPNHASAMVQIAQELLKQRDLEAATRWANQAVHIAPRNFVARRVLGQIKLEANDLAGAITELETAVKLEPDSPSVHYTLARAYQRAGRSADAERERAEFTRLERLQQEQRGAVDK
jgi:tetratricopeptide (TPR) repeat protein